MFINEIKKLKRNDLLRHIISRSSPQGPVITVGGKRYINFSSNDYLGLAGHPDILRSARESLRDYAFGSGASRLLAGGTELHEKLEQMTARFKGTESALLLNSGYTANCGIIPALTAEHDVIFSDEKNHASIIDGCRLSRAKTVIYTHRDMDHLAELMKKKAERRMFVITDTIFSMDGDIAPLAEIVQLCRLHNAILYLDDAHGTGVLGKGKGALAHFRVNPESWIIQMGTFSKALGSFGAFVAASEDVITWISNTARTLIFSTALPSCVISASLKALELLLNDTWRIKGLWKNTEKVRAGLKTMNYDIMESETPIIPVRTDSIKTALRLSAQLFKKGIYAPAIRPPAVKTPRMRLTVTAAHTEEHLDLLLDSLRNIAI